MKLPKLVVPAMIEKLPDVLVKPDWVKNPQWAEEPWSSPVDGHANLVEGHQGLLDRAGVADVTGINAQRGLVPVVKLGLQQLGTPAVVQGSQVDISTAASDNALSAKLAQLMPEVKNAASE